jgi:hypothetical protein
MLEAADGSVKEAGLYAPVNLDNGRYPGRVADRRRGLDILDALTETS